MGLEKNFQGECRSTFLEIGTCYKQVQDATKCSKCYNIVYPHHKGWADYHAEIWYRGRLIPLKIECKAGVDRINFSEIKPEQREYLDWFDNLYAVFPSKSFIWLQLGDQRVNSSEPLSRRVWLVLWSYFKELMMITEAETGCSYIPYRDNMKGLKVKKGAVSLFENDEMQWSGDGIWKPRRTHSLWKYFNHLDSDRSPNRSRDYFDVLKIGKEKEKTDGNSN